MKASTFITGAIYALIDLAHGAICNDCSVGPDQGAIAQEAPDLAMGHGPGKTSSRGAERRVACFNSIGGLTGTYAEEECVGKPPPDVAYYGRIVGGDPDIGCEIHGGTICIRRFDTEGNPVEKHETDSAKGGGTGDLAKGVSASTEGQRTTSTASYANRDSEATVSVSGACRNRVILSG